MSVGLTCNSIFCLCHRQTVSAIAFCLNAACTAVSATVSRLRTASGGSRWGAVPGGQDQEEAVYLVVCGVPAASTTGRTRTESRLHRTVRIPARRRFVGRVPRHWVRALKLLAKQQTGGDSLVDTIFEGLQ